MREFRSKSTFFDFFVDVCRISSFSFDVMNATEIDLRDFPADVQDLLKDRAVREHRPIGEVIAEYVVEVARAIVANAGNKPEAAA
jgi:hypothetical protein